METKNVVMIGNAVVDYVYPKIPVDGIENDFMSAMPDLFPAFVKELPRPGDTLFVLAEMMEEGAAKFLKKRGLYNAKAVFNNKSALEQLFGAHKKYAGGSIANTMAALQHSHIGGKPLVNGKIVSTLSEGADGDTFEAEMPAGSMAGTRYGQGLVCHVLPIGDDRTMVTTPHVTKPSTDHNLAIDVANNVIDENTDIVMFEGFVAHDEAHFEEIFDTMLREIEAANMVRQWMMKPAIQLVLTASSQGVAAMESYQKAVARAVNVTDVTVHSNTGELRRLMQEDTAWRKPFEPALAGITNARDLDKTKKGLTGYREAKTQANIDAILGAALPMVWKSSYNVRFVMTDGGNDAFFVDKNGYQTFAPKPLAKKDMIGRVGAGDAQMAGFWAAQIAGADIKDSMYSGFAFAAACIKQHEARLSPDLKWPKNDATVAATGPVSLLGHHDDLRASVLKVAPLLPVVSPATGLKNGPA